MNPLARNLRAGALVDIDLERKVDVRHALVNGARRKDIDI